MGARDFRHSELPRLTILLAGLRTTWAIPTISFPINAQVPPVARVGQPFQFTFSPSTFEASSTVHYSLANNPAWLHFDDRGRSFSGTPNKTDVGALNLTLTAIDESGSTTLPFVFVVSAASGPGLGIGLSQQLAQLSGFSAPSTLILYPSAQLSISFKPETFKNTDEYTNYYAVSSNNSPLPSWVHFDPAALSFTGQTPESTSEYQLPQDFAISLSASDTRGFSGPVLTFHVIVSRHELTFGNTRLEIKTSPGRPVSFTGLQSALTLDKKSAKSSDLKSIRAFTPGWLSLDSSSLIITGNTPAENLKSDSFFVEAVDFSGDKATTTVFVSSTDPKRIIKGTIAPLEATIGKEFSYKIDRNLFTSPNVDAKIDLRDLSWLHYDSGSGVLSGIVPDDFHEQHNILNLTAKQDGLVEFQLFDISFIKDALGNITPYGSPTTSDDPASTVTTHPTTQVSQDTEGPTTPNHVLIIAIVLPVTITLTALLLICLIARRKRRARARVGASGASHQALTASPFPDLQPGPLSIQKPTAIHTRSRSKPPSVGVIPHLRIPGTRSSLAQSISDRGSQMLERSFTKHGSLTSTIQHAIGPLFPLRSARPNSSGDFAILDERVGVTHGQTSFTRTSKRISSGRPLNALLGASRIEQRVEKYSVPPLGAPRSSRRVSGFGHGKGFLDNVASGRTPLRQLRSNSLVGFRYDPSYSKARSISRERSTTWSTTNESVSQSEFPAPPSRAAIVSSSNDSNDTSGGCSTIRPVRPSPDASPLKNREMYYKQRRQSFQSQPGSGFFATSTRRSSGGWNKLALVAEPSDPFGDIVTLDAPNISSFTRSKSSGFRKGKMMQRVRSATSIPNPKSSVGKVAVETTKHTMGFGKPPKIHHFSTDSRSTLDSHRRFENADVESEYSSYVDDYVEEYDEPSWLDGKISSSHHISSSKPTSSLPPISSSGSNFSIFGGRSSGGNATNGTATTGGITSRLANVNWSNPFGSGSSICETAGSENIAMGSIEQASSYVNGNEARKMAGQKGLDRMRHEGRSLRASPAFV